jgi:2-phospho-L-lactate transferase/gluconeogenesis factor (CofD/UPF0052 family)
MEEDMSLGEIAVKEANENQTRKIFELVEKSKGKEEAIEKIKALLDK